MAAPSNFYMQPAYNESVSAVTLTNSVLLGSVRMEGGEEYVYVYNDGGASMTVGYLAVPQSGSSGYSVTVTSVTGYDFPMGFVKHTTFPTAAYGWLITKGYSPVTNGMGATGLVSGDIIVPAGNGQVCVAATGLTAVFAPIIGRMISATSANSAASGKAFIRCFGT